MYLSKVTINSSGNPAEVFKKIYSNGTYGIHQSMWKLFTTEEKRQFLFREEIDGSGLPFFYVLSANSPAKSKILKTEVKPFNPQLKKDQRLAFSLRVNPTITTKDSKGKGKRHDVMMHAKHQLRHENRPDEEVCEFMEQAAREWMSDEERLARWGIQLDTVPDIKTYTQHRSRKKKELIQYSSVDFQGTLRVVEPEKFLSAYAGGFGRARAFGCGLMLIRSV